jgi:hypothetical protein
MRRMIDQGTSNAFAASAIDVVAARDSTPFSEAPCTPMRALILAYLVSPAAKMRKQADAQVAPCPTFVDIFADLASTTFSSSALKFRSGCGHTGLGGWCKAKGPDLHRGPAPIELSRFHIQDMA